MTFTQHLGLLAQALFSYDATVAKGNRRPPAARSRGEDLELGDRDRRVVITSANDLNRNFSIAAWAVRKHLDYTTTFSFQCRSGDDAVDEQVELLMDWYSKRMNCDLAGRHPLRRLIRLAETCRLLHGDVFLNMLEDGKLQAIEADRVQTPRETVASLEPSAFVNGVQVDAFGRAISYAVHKRDGSSFLFEQLLPASFVLPHGFYQRFDQVRGISPIVAAINPMQDVYEANDYALAKAKVAQLFALAIYRDSSEQLGALDTEEQSDGSDRYNINFGRGPIKLDLDPGDRAEFLESKSPSTEFQAYTSMMIASALKALDIPFSFFDESFTNYSGARQALIQYEQSAAIKRGEVRELLDRITAWRLGLGIRDGDLILPRGMRVSDIKFEWIHQGVPWIDPLKEVEADVVAIKAGLISPQQVSKEQGRDYYETIDQIADAQAYAAAKGVTIDLGSSPAPAPQSTQDPAQPEEDPATAGE